MRLNRQVIPSTGWKYQQGETWINAMTWSELVTNVICHRQSNNLELGNPEHEIEEQLIKNNPHSKVGQFKSISKK